MNTQPILTRDVIERYQQSLAEAATLHDRLFYQKVLAYVTATVEKREKFENDRRAQEASNSTN